MTGTLDKALTAYDDFPFMPLARYHRVDVSNAVIDPNGNMVDFGANLSFIFNTTQTFQVPIPQNMAQVVVT